MFSHLASRAYALGLATMVTLATLSGINNLALSEHAGNDLMANTSTSSQTASIARPASPRI